MAETQHSYEVSFDDNKETQHTGEKEKANVTRTEGGVSVTVPPPTHQEDSLAISQDAVSPAFAEAIEQAVINSTNDEVGLSQERDAHNVTELKKENAVLREEMNNITTLLTNEKQEKMKTLKEMAEHANALEQRHTSQITSLQNALKEAEEQVKHVRTEARQHEERVSLAEAQVRSLHEKETERLRIVELDKRAADAEAHVRKAVLENVAQSAEEQIRGLREQLNATSHELETAKKTIHEAELKSAQQVEELISEVSTLGTKLRSQEHRLKAELDAKSEVVSNLETLKSQLRVREAEYVVSQQDKAQSLAKLGQINVIVSELKKQNAELLRQLEEERAKHSTAAKLASTVKDTKPPLSSSAGKPTDNWRPYSKWVPSVLFIGLSAVAAAKLLNNK